MLFVHEVHSLIGEKEAEFEAVYRDEWLPTLGASADARLAWYLRHPPVVGEAFTVVTLTAVRDASAWQRLDENIRGGALRTLALKTDGLRREVVSKVLAPLDNWVTDFDLDTVAVAPGEHASAMWIEDTLWPFEGKLDAYVDAAGKFARMLKKPAQRGDAYLEPMIGLRTAFGGGVRREVVALSRIVDPQAWLRDAINGLPAGFDLGWDELKLRERWRTYALNTPTWAPIW